MGVPKENMLKHSRIEYLYFVASWKNAGNK
jgi:hypothetical protein